MAQDSAGHNKEIVGRFLDEVFNEGYVQTVDQFVSADVIDHDAVVFAQPEGPGRLEDSIRTFLHAFPDFRVGVEQMIAEGDYVAVRLQMSGTNAGDYRGLPEPTDRHASWDAIAFFRLSGGKIVEIWGTADRMSMLTQLGVLPDIG